MPCSAGIVAGYVYQAGNGKVGQPGVTVQLMRAGQTAQDTITDGSGHYEFTGVSNGVYAVQITAPAGFMSRRRRPR